MTSSTGSGILPVSLSPKEQLMAHIDDPPTRAASIGAEIKDKRGRAA
jgi:hypothetical protein